MNYYLRKTIIFAVTLFCVAAINFLLFTVIPGNAALSRLGTEATPEKIEQLSKSYGLDKSIPERFVSWLGGAVTGDFGMSSVYPTRTVSELIGKRLPVTAGLAFISLLLIIIISIPIGLVGSKKPGGIIDRITDISALAFMSIPSFILGIVITVVFGVVLRWFVPGSYTAPSESFFGYVGCLIFPALSIAIPKTAMTVRFLKASVRRELSEDYVRTARAKGNTRDEVLSHHVLKNSLLPVITFIGLIVAEVMAGSIITEKVFDLDGIGMLLISSISKRDMNVVQAVVMYIAATVVTVNFIVDMIYRKVDPRT
ncbi:MAG: ABC transporter permease [Lachnospiraceae bacterium]|nr:ABC transporter permease [Lachnospiraceae bacterium]MBR5369584.1 ABC transporter permease [Lachnospiraceae bacterium]